MDNKKTWYEKVHVCIGILCGLLTATISIFTIKDRLINSDTKQNQTSTAISQKEKVEIHPTKTYTQKPLSNIIVGSPSDGIYEQSIEGEIEPELSEKHTASISGTNVNISKWKHDEDLDSCGNMYKDGNKVTISNYSYTSDSKIENKVKSTIIFTKSIMTEKYYKNNTFTGAFVLHKNTIENESRGTISILIDNIKVFTTGIIDGNTTKTFPFSIYCGDIDTITIEADITLKGNYFIYGIVNIDE